MGLRRVVNFYTYIQICKKKWRLGCLNLLLWPEGAKRCDSSNLAFPFYCKSVDFLARSWHLLCRMPSKSDLAACMLVYSWILNRSWSYPESCPRQISTHRGINRSHCASSFSNSNYWGISTCTALLHIYLYPRWWRVLQQDRGFSSFGDFHSKYIFSMPVSQLLLSRTWLGWPKIQKNSKYPW